MAGEPGGLQSGLLDEGRATQGGDGRGLQPLERLHAEERGAHQGCGALGLQSRLAEDEEARRSLLNVVVGGMVGIILKRRAVVSRWYSPYSPLS